MAESILFKGYSKLPIWVQNTACSLAGFNMRRVRYGKTFRESLAFFEKSQWWSLNDYKEYQNERLREIISHAFESVPYYHQVMKERKLCPADIRTVEDLHKLPILTKDMVREHYAELISSSWPKSRMRYGKTGGTTGKALKLVYDDQTHQRQWAIWWRHRMRFGLKLNDEFIVFAGRDVIPMNNIDPPFWRRNLPMHQTYVSIHHMTEKNMAALLKYLCERRDVKYYSGYPSAVYLIANYLLDKEISLPVPPKVVTLGAETLLPHQRRIIEQAFGGAIVTDQYGASEQCGNISACEKNNYHVDMEFGAVEFLPMEEIPSNVCRIVCTGFWNKAMPLIRYDIGDIATLPEKEKRRCTCGRQSPIVEKIDGRIESYIITPDGRQLGRLDFLFKDSYGIDDAQLLQDEVESVTIKVVKNGRYDSRQEQQLQCNLKKYLGDVIQIRIEYVHEIPRTANGKFRQIVSNVFKDQQALASIQENN